MKRFIVVITCVSLAISLASCGMFFRGGTKETADGTITFGSGSAAPKEVSIDGTTYLSGFYGDLYPVFGERGDIGSEALEKEIIYDDGKNKFRRVDFEGHDWVHSYAGGYTGGIVYCADNQWEQMRDYYADPDNFEYFYGVGYYISESSVNIPEIDLEKFDELLAFGKNNIYNPFDNRSNKQIMQNARRIPKSEFNEGICFFKVSKDGFFMTAKYPMYFVHDSKLLLVFYHDGGSKNGGIEEVVAIDVPDELGQYFIGLIGR